MSRERRPQRSRRLSDDEHALWKTVTRSIKPLRPTRQEENSAEARSTEPGVQPSPATPATIARPAATKERAAAAFAPLERRLRHRLAKGHVTIERRLDLHGMTQREAHDALGHFLRSAQAHGARIVLVVTGKGERNAERDPFAERGVLRRLVPQWLKRPELRALVVSFDTAHVGHGGEGALYVRLRRPR